MQSLAAETVADARWFPFRYDRRLDEVQFAWIPQEVHRAVTFLFDLNPEHGQRRPLPRAEVAAIPVTEAPLHFILHSGLGGSTLLARALAQPGVVTTFKEPPILTDTIAFGLASTPNDAAKLRRDLAPLFARHFSPGEAIVLKMSSIGNGLVTELARDRPASRILCLQTPLDEMLASLAGRRPEGRSGGRKLFIGLRNSRMADFGIGEEELAAMPDLQLAALGWLAIQRMMVEAADKLGERCVRSIGSDRWLGSSRESLEAIAAHFKIQLDVDSRLASGIFDRHSKTGEAFDAGERSQRLKKILEDHGAEIRPIVGWARKVADANHIAWDLPYPLFP